MLTWKTTPLAEEIPRGSIFRVNTGGPLPAGTDAVIMVEDTELVSTIKDANGQDVEESQVKTLVQVPRGENVRPIGLDVRTGDLVLKKDDVLTSLGGEIGTLTFVGQREVRRVACPFCMLNNVTTIGQSPRQTCCGTFEHRQRNCGPAITESGDWRRMGRDI